MTQWALQTQSTSYVVSLLPDADGIALDYWGRKTDVPVPRWSERPQIVHYQNFIDVAPLEYASAGQRHVGFSELLIDRGDSYTGACWKANESDLKFESDEEGDVLETRFRDETGNLELTLITRTSRSHDVITRTVAIKNLGESSVELPRAYSAAWNILDSRTVRINYLAGRWGEEFQRRENVLSWGTLSMGSRSGITHQGFSPVVTITPIRDADSSSVSSAGAWGVALQWSGSWRLQVDSDPLGQPGVRVSCGVDDDTTTVTLLPGEEFTAPPSLGAFSADGPEGVTQAWHEYQRSVLVRDLSPERRPVIYNSWYVTEFDVLAEHQLELARLAKEMGVETFMVDDGWFKGRVNDKAGLGDWVPDPAKFPDGLVAFADAINEIGLGLGMWVEPEMVNPDSDLYRAHPDWVYRAGDRPQLTIRNQYVLDLGKPDVEEWICGALRDLLNSASISYLKWDMNRTVSDGGRVGDPHGRQWSIQHTNAYYRIMQMLRDEFPDVTIEACAGGGARIDNAVLGLTDLTWVSDDAGARDRLVIQDGFLSAYPAYSMLQLVVEWAGIRDQTEVSFPYKFVVGMAGVLGIGGEITKWDQDQLETAKQLIALYKEIRSVVYEGSSRTHGSPYDDLYCVEYRAAHDDDGRIVLFVYDSDRERGGIVPRVYPSQLDPARSYQVETTGQIVDRASALSYGVVVPFSVAPDADVIVLTPIS